MLVVSLVDDHDDRLGRAAQLVGKFFVGGGDALFTVDNEDDDVGLFHGDLSLGANLRAAAGRFAHLDTAGVDQRVGAPVPFAVGVQSVTGDAGHVLDDGDAPADKAVEKGGFADIGSSDNRDKGLIGLRDFGLRLFCAHDFGLFPEKSIA